MLTDGPAQMCFARATKAALLRTASCTCISCALQKTANNETEACRPVKWTHRRTWSHATVKAYTSPLYFEERQHLYEELATRSAQDGEG